MAQTRHQKKIAEDLEKVLKHPEAHEVKNRYRTIRAALHSKYATLIENTDKEKMLEFIKDIVYLDRKLRQLTEGEEDDIKQTLAQEKQIELGYTPGHANDIHTLSLLQ